VSFFLCVVVYFIGAFFVTFFFKVLLGKGDFCPTLVSRNHVRVCRDDSDDESLLRLSVRGEKKKRVAIAVASVLIFREEECADLYIGRRKTASIRFG
tara:strand:- start:204 stop:494 length:291 start_codon:yes stop_codon:yes gene_type:complete